ncbi:MAG: DNA topoisomerase VI subunit B [Candidatus Brocadiae bacterium]|nr:DNA topoisomerase VI subunit B [Candidatus Brocadiia bacterium]
MAEDRVEPGSATSSAPAVKAGRGSRVSVVPMAGEGAAEPAPRRRGAAHVPQTAESLAKRQREISVSEFFAKNRHLLGFDNPKRALMTAVKEAVDNSLDACEEAGVLPDLLVEIQMKSEDRFRLIVEDNGPGIVKAQVPKIFGKLLYGSKFHTMKQSRGQQGIGISAAGLYAQITAGQPVRIVTRTGAKKPAYECELHLDTTKNQAELVHEKETDTWHRDHGTRVELEFEGKYEKGRRSVDEYIRQTAIANPHLTLTYISPLGEKTVYPRQVQTNPEPPKEIKPHPYGVELGTLIKMMRSTGEKKMQGFLCNDFSRVSSQIAHEILGKAGLTSNTWVQSVGLKEAEALHKAIPQVKIMAPPTNCISPIGEDRILAGLKATVKAKCYVATTRRPSVYRGNPFLVEAAIAWDCDGMDSEDPVTLFRYANRVPLLYQQSACAIAQAATETSWKNYGLSQPRGSLPLGPAVLFIHFASVWVPFTSESKDAIANYAEVEKEIKLALQEVGRKIGTFIRQQEHAQREAKRRQIFERYAAILSFSLAYLQQKGAVGESKLATVQKQADRINGWLVKIAKRESALADRLIKGSLVAVDKDVHVVADTPAEPPADTNE